MSGTGHWGLHLVSQAFSKLYFRERPVSQAMWMQPCWQGKVGKWGPFFIQLGSPADMNNVSLLLFITLEFPIFLLCQRNIIEIINITIAYHLSNASKLRNYRRTCNCTFFYQYRIFLESVLNSDLGVHPIAQPDTAAILSLAQSGHSSITPLTLIQETTAGTPRKQKGKTVGRQTLCKI